MRCSRIGTRWSHDLDLPNWDRSYPHIQVHVYDIEVNVADLTEQRNALRKVVTTPHWNKADSSRGAK